MRTNNSMQVKYEKAFNDKINALKNHSKYNWLREYSDTAIANHTGAGFLQIRAADFMDRIIAMPVTLHPQSRWLLKSLRSGATLPLRLKIFLVS